jgi:hypothetical protein
VLKFRAMRFNKHSKKLNLGKFGKRVSGKITFRENVSLKTF